VQAPTARHIVPQTAHKPTRSMQGGVAAQGSEGHALVMHRHGCAYAFLPNAGGCAGRQICCAWPRGPHTCVVSTRAVALALIYCLRPRGPRQHTAKRRCGPTSGMAALPALGWEATSNFRTFVHMCVQKRSAKVKSPRHSTLRTHRAARGPLGRCSLGGDGGGRTSQLYSPPSAKRAHGRGGVRTW
jgi:hypothetical protein